jgi:hypothetical protein
MARAEEDLEALYDALSELRERLGGFRYLRECDGRMEWPARGVYFFFDERELRSSPGLRVVRVGTHALRVSDRTTLWGRLSNYRGHIGGHRPGGGNHRGSVFRRHVGAALLVRDGDPAGLLPYWKDPTAPKGAIGESEYAVELSVSGYIGGLPFVWVPVLDTPGPSSDRGAIESNSIALLSTAGRSIDPAGEEWLGRSAPSEAVRRSGLWNVRHVGEPYDPAFIATLRGYGEQT